MNSGWQWSLSWSESWLGSCRCVIILTVKTLSDSHSLSASLIGGGGGDGVRMECNVNKLYPIDWGVELNPLPAGIGTSSSGNDHLAQRGLNRGRI